MINTASTAYNYNPYIDFTGPIGSIVVGGTDPIRQFIRLVGYDGSSGINYKSLFFALQLTDLTRVYTHLGVTSNVTGAGPPTDGTIHGYANGTNASIQNPGYDDLDFGALASADTWKRNGTSISPLSDHTTSKQILSAISSTTNGTVINRFLGGQIDASGFNAASRDWNGPVGELIGFTSRLTATERSKVHSYLAIKYGVTLSENYLSTSGGTLFSLTGAYTSNIIGIGRDDIEGLLQKQSHQNDDKVRLYFGSLAATNSANASTITNDISYVVMGSNAGALCTTTASNAEKPTGLAGCSLNSRIEREWKVTRTNNSQNFQLSISLDACAVPASVNVAHLRLLVDTDGDFSNGGTTCYYNGDGSGLVFTYANPRITITGINSTMIPNNATRYITLASTNNLTPLPIEMISYEATVNELNVVQLDWKTATERDSYLFTIERSNDLNQWEKIGELAAAGNSTTPIAYTLIDYTPQPGENYYRLNQYDLNGTLSYSEIRSVLLKSTSLFSFYPNPADQSIIITSSNFKNASILLLNSIGAVVYEHDATTQNSGFTIDAQDFAPGVYFIQFRTEKAVETQKLILKRN